MNPISGIMAPESKPAVPSKSSNFAQNVTEGMFAPDLEDVMDEDLRSQNLPKMNELALFAEKAQQGITKKDVEEFQKEKEKKEWADATDSGNDDDDDDDNTETEAVEDDNKLEDQDDVEQMIEDVKTPVQSSFKPSATEQKRPSFKPKDRKPSMADDETYQESFTSQQESAEMRHHIESLDTRLMNMESMFEGLLAERKGLPKHLDNYREEMNKQLTVMMDRIHTALEKDIPASSLEQSKGDIQNMTGETDHVFNQLTTDVENDPSKQSATANTAPITKSRRRVRLIK